MENEALLEKFQTLTEEKNYRELSVYLDDQLITDIAELIHEVPDDADGIITNLSIGRAAAAFSFPAAACEYQSGARAVSASRRC